MISKIKIIAIGAAVLTLFVAGWTACSWYRDSVDLAQEKAVNKAIAAFESKESQIANDVNAKLAELKANERTKLISVPEIIKQVEYQNVCISSDGLTIINDSINELLNVSRDTNAE